MTLKTGVMADENPVLQSQEKIVLYLNRNAYFKHCIDVFTVLLLKCLGEHT